MSINQVEKKLIELIKEKSKTADGIPGLGIGDDAAFLLLSSMEEGKLVVSTDSVVENVHYKTDWCSYADVAVKLVERASSDLLAKGAHPHWALLNMNITEEFSKNISFYELFIDAFCQKLKDHHIVLIGGDITRSATNTFTMTVLGNTSTFIRRSNPEIETGDLVVMWGEIGGSSYAMNQLLREKVTDEEISGYYRRPVACWENDWLVKLQARASMDQSDSVLETLETLSLENQIHLKINLDLIPLSMKMDDSKPKDVVRSILSAAEDLAIFAIIPSSQKASLQNYPKISVLGSVLEKNPENKKEAQISFFWKNEPQQKDETFKDFYQHF